MNPIRTMVSRQHAAGFTLVELLVVMMLLSVLMVLTSAFGSRSLDLIGQVGSKSAADRIAELVFEQIVRDIDQRVNRREPTMRVEKNDSEGDDELVLVTRRFGLPEGAAEADRRVSTVHYRITDHVLLQGAEGFGFGEPASPPSREEGTLSLHELPAEGPEELDDDALQPLVGGVIRMEFAFVTPGADGALEIVADAPASPMRPEALIVTLAVLDPERTRMIDPGQRARIAAEFPDAEDGETPGERWQEIARGLAGRADALGVPAVALRQVRVYQRRVSLTSGGTL